MTSQIVAQTKRQRQPEIAPGAFSSLRNGPRAFVAPQTILTAGMTKTLGLASK
jgi:hypothetical protein